MSERVLGILGPFCLAAEPVSGLSGAHAAFLTAIATATDTS
jgi:hypothetical protein